MLFRASTLEEIAAGRVTVAFRRWRRPRVKPGSTIRTALGVVQIVSVDPFTRDRITERDARHAGYATRAALLDELDRYPNGDVYRMGLRSGGADPRIALRARGALTAGQHREVEAAVARLGARTADGPWAMRVLRLIGARPGVRAARLAQEIGMDTLPFKTRVRQLKNLGLTESLEIGYRLSPRGAAFLQGVRAPASD